MNKKELNRKIRKMKSTIVIIENKVQEYIKYESRDINNINPLFVRNILYLNSIIDNIAKNLVSLSEIKEVNDSNREMISKKTATSVYLLSFLNDLTKTYSILDSDFEVYNLVLYKNNLPSVLTNIPKKYQEVVKEEFEKITKERKIIEDFNLSGITRVFSKIAGGFRMIINVLTKIGRFIGGMLVKFIKMMMKLVQFIFKLVFKIIPQLIKNTFFFLKNLVIKFAKVGPFCCMLFAGILLTSMKYWQQLIETDVPPMPVIVIPTIIITWFLFWNQTEAIWQLQLSILRGFVNLLIGPVKNITIGILGLPKDDRFFTYRQGQKLNGQQMFKKITLLMAMLAKNAPVIMTRVLLAILAIKYFIKLALPVLMEEGIPNFRDFLLFPYVIIKWIQEQII